MAKGVFTHKPLSRYDDVPWEHYHFPRTYLRTVERIVGDLVVYYEPGRLGLGDARGGREAYVAVARVVDVVPDPERADHFYGRIEPGSYLEFVQPVPFRIGGRCLERRLEKREGTVNRGAFGRAVRLLEEDEFEAICRLGFGGLPPQVVESARAAEVDAPGLAEAPVPFEVERPITELLAHRPLRDRAFAERVVAAYEGRCAITGIALRNGRGRPEVEAAHIRPVAAGGPDTVRNGLALSRTVHWMFDRGLITLDDDFRLILSRRAELPEELRGLLAPDRPVRLPGHPADRPHPAFLAWHREHVFLGS